MDLSLLLSSYATVWSNPEVLLKTFIGALGGVQLGAARRGLAFQGCRARCSQAGSDLLIFRRGL